MNVLENLPIFAAVVLAGVVSGAANATFNGLAMIVLLARAIQIADPHLLGLGGAINRGSPHSPSRSSASSGWHG